MVTKRRKVKPHERSNRTGQPGSAHGGTVFDIGYQPYTGVREGRSRGRRAIFKDGVRTALGIGRGGRAKILPWLFIVALSALGLVFAIVAAAANAMGGPGGADKAGIPIHSDFYGIASVMLFVFAAVVAPDLLSPDKRNGVINLYRVRPITGTDYIVSRWAAFLSVMLIAVWLPQILLFLGLSGSDPVPMDYLTEELARHSAFHSCRRGNGRVRDEPGDACCIIHYSASICFRVSCRVVRHHCAVYGRPLSGDRGRGGTMDLDVRR